MGKHITEQNPLVNNWNSAYTSVNSQSATWGTGGDDVLASSKVRASSADWDTTYTSVNANSGRWSDAYSTVNNLSSGWGGGGGDDVLVSSKVRASSANWDSTYNTVTNLSGNWSGLPQVSRFTILESDFTGATASVACEGLFGTAISSGVLQGATLAGGPHHPGVAAFRDSTTANGGYRLMTDVNAFLIAGGEKAKFIFRVDTAVLSSQMRFGFLDTTTNAMPTDGVFFDIDGFGATQFTLSGTCRANAAAVSTATNVPIVSGAWYTGQFEINSAASLVTFTVYSSAGALLWTDTVASQIPTAVGRETGFGIVVTERSVNAAADRFSIDYLSLEINRTLNRY